jgi:hypothetical protein
MMEILKKLGVDWKDRRLIMNLYMSQSAKVRINNEYSEKSEIGCGVRQGCCLSPLLFSLYAEMMMIEAMEEIEEGIKVGGKLRRDIRFADDQGMVASTEAGLQRIMDALNETAAKFNMKINVKKTKSMKVSKKGGGAMNIVVNGEKIEQVTRFKYLGSWITEDGRCEVEIRARIGMAKEAFGKRRELLKRRMNKELKKKVIKTVIWSTALYACETWTLKEDERRRLRSFEMWLWRRMEGISWTEKRTDEEVLKLVSEERSIISTIEKRKKNWIGHTLRHDGLMKEVIEGKMEGKRQRGRPRIGMLEEFKEVSYVDMKRRAEDRENWRSWKPRTCQ